MSTRSHLSSEYSDPAFPLRVLIVDDCQDAADSLAMLMRLWGHQSIAAYDGFSALAVIEQQALDLLVIDLAMPGLDGIELAQIVRHRFETPPTLIALTGFIDAAHRRDAAAAGFDHYLIKPTDPLLLQEILSDLRQCKVTSARPCAELVPG